jgi:hypothetical protein
VVDTVQKLKDFLQHRRRDHPGWQLGQAEVDLAADLLAPCCRFTPRLICQATGGSLGTVSDLLDIWWRAMIAARPQTRPKLLDEPGPQALSLREHLKHLAALRAQAPEDLDLKELLATLPSPKSPPLQGQLDALRLQNETLVAENRQRRAEVLDLKRELGAAIGTVFRDVREPMSELRQIARKLSALVKPQRRSRTRRPPRHRSRRPPPAAPPKRRGSPHSARPRAKKRPRAR